MADNEFLNTQWVSMEILRILLNRAVISEYFNRDWEGDFQKDYAVGASIDVKLPWRPKVIDGMGYVPQGIQRLKTTISLDEWIQIPFEWDDYERAVKLERGEDQLRENYWDPCGAAMAQEFDSRCAFRAYQHASNVVGVLGTSPTSVETYYSARQKLMEASCPPGKRAMIISSQMMVKLGANITTMFHPEDELVRMFKEGSIGKMAGFSWFESNSLYQHTCGNWAILANVQVYGSNQTGTQLRITCGAGDTFKAGDKFNIALVNKVNPATRRVAGAAELRTFTITQDLTAVGGGDPADVLNILPAIYGPGHAYQNVDALPQNAAVLTLWPGSSIAAGTPKTGTVALALSKYAFGLVGAKLYVPKAVEKAGAAQDPDSGISVRKVIAWDPQRSMQVNRMDSLFGMGDLYQDNGACVVAGA